MSSQFLKIGSHHPENFHQSRRKYATFTIYDHTKCFLGGIRIFITSLIYQCIVYIGDGYELRRQWDIFSGKSIRISFSIVAFMVMAADLITCLHGFSAPVIFNRIQKRKTGTTQNTFFLSSLSGSLSRTFLIFSRIFIFFLHNCCRGSLSMLE